MKYWTISALSEKLRAFNFIIGGRGIGKTYSCIDYLVNSGERFLYLRNTKTELDESVSEFGNPFKKWNSNNNRNIILTTEKKHIMIYDAADEENKKLIGYAAALSTFHNLRGVDLSDVRYVLHDEFIERSTLSYDQFKAFANMYETINRNRELDGEQPLCVICLSNAQKLDNPILAGYGCVPIIERMIKTGRREHITDDMYICMAESEISQLKADTANYRITKGSKYYDEALRNNFAYDSFADIVKRPINEYLPICGFDDWFIWKHKSNGKYYVCRSASNRVTVYNEIDNKHVFLKRYGVQLRIAYVSGIIEYSEFMLKSALKNIIM